MAAFSSSARVSSSAFVAYMPSGEKKFAVK